MQLRVFLLFTSLFLSAVLWAQEEAILGKWHLLPFNPFGFGKSSYTWLFHENGSCEIYYANEEKAENSMKWSVEAGQLKIWETEDDDKPIYVYDLLAKSDAKVVLKDQTYIYLLSRSAKPAKVSGKFLLRNRLFTVLNDNSTKPLTHWF